MHILGNTAVRHTFNEGEFRMHVITTFKIHNHCITARSRASRILRLISMSVGNSSAKVFLKYYLVLIIPNLDYAVQFWAPYHNITERTLIPSNMFREE